MQAHGDAWKARSGAWSRSWRRTHCRRRDMTIAELAPLGIAAFVEVLQSVVLLFELLRIWSHRWQFQRFSASYCTIWLVSGWRSVCWTYIFRKFDATLLWIETRLNDWLNPRNTCTTCNRQNNRFQQRGMEEDLTLIQIMLVIHLRDCFHTFNC